MTEYIDILNNKGEKTGESLEYNDVHKTGAIHRTVHVWLINSKKQLLLQKRSKNKRAYPGLWDISVGGHISSGQTSLEAAQREVREEIGQIFSDKDFNFLFTIRQSQIEHGKDFIDEEFNDVYIVRCDLDVEFFKIEKDEVDEVKWINLDEFALLISNNDQSLVPHSEEYKLLLEILSK